MKAEEASDSEFDVGSGWDGTTTDWNYTYGGTGDDEISASIETGDGGYAVAGWTSSFGAGGYDFWLVKTDSSGHGQWNMTYGGTSDEYLFSLCQTADAGYIMAGQTNSFGAGSFDFWLVKADSSGNMQWNKTYGGIGADYAYCVVLTIDGGYALAGATNSYGAGDYDFWLVKTDSSGNMQWNKTYGGTNRDEGRSVVLTSDGGYALAGYASLGAGSLDFWLVKTDSSGNMQWNKTYGGIGPDMGRQLVLTIDGGYALAGATNSYGAGDYDFWLVKTDSSGNMIWNNTYGGTNTDRACSVVLTSDGGYALAGYTWSFGAGWADFWLVKLTPITVYVNADGSVDPSTAPIQRNGDLYTLTNNICGTAGIVLQRSNIVVDGNGYEVQGAGVEYGFLLSDITNVTVQDTVIKSFMNGIRVIDAADITITSNVVTVCGSGISINGISDSKILSNVIDQHNGSGIGAINVQTLTIESNVITNNEDAIQLGGSESTIISNNLSNNSHNGLYIGAMLDWGVSNVIKLNDIEDNQEAGVRIDLPEQFHNNSIYHNNIANNPQQIAFSGTLGVNNWDNGYPYGGNYWADYIGTDIFEGPNQDIAGSDGIGDTPYIIGVNNSDRYPFTNPLAHTNAGSNVTVYPLIDVVLTFENVTKAGSTSACRTDTLPGWMPSLPDLVDSYVDVAVTAISCGKITVAVSYDDTNMTLEEEEGLQLSQWKGCDVTGPTPSVLDGIINMRDIALFANKFMILGGSEQWEPRCDVTGPTPGVPDGVVNMRDIAEACVHFTGTNSWVHITTYIDTVNNIIYGETTHFSIFGVH